jgi:hypothetical protein
LEFVRAAMAKQSIVIVMRKRQENDEVLSMSVAFLIVDVQAHSKEGGPNFLSVYSITRQL